MQTKIDHLVIGAGSLAQGVAYVRERLGVDMPFGGVHEKMGTHNHLMQLGNDIFLEILAINHDMEPPTRPRWFSLDDAFIRQRIEKQPALLTWVVNTQNIKGFMTQAGFSMGTAEFVTRGNLNWYFGLPADGRLIAGGLLPYAIEWQTDTHPSANMADLACRFRGLEIYHPYPRWLESALASIGASNLVTIKALGRNETPYMIVYIDTPDGVKELRSHPEFDEARQGKSR
jgi:hypothetical protein